MGALLEKFMDTNHVIPVNEDNVHDVLSALEEVGFGWYNGLKFVGATDALSLDVMSETARSLKLGTSAIRFHGMRDGNKMMKRGRLSNYVADGRKVIDADDFICEIAGYSQAVNNESLLSLLEA